MAASRACSARSSMDAGEIVEEVTDSGLRGRGGAGFPTGIKWKTVARRPTADQKYIVCNADEGDSGTFADRMLMEGDPFMPDRRHDDRRPRRRRDARATSTSAPNIPHAFATLNARHRDRARQPATSAPTSAAAASAFDLEVRLGAGAYICGEETSLLESLEGKRGVDPLQAAAAGDQGSVRQADRRSTT